MSESGIFKSGLFAPNSDLEAREWQIRRHLFACLSPIVQWILTIISANNTFLRSVHNACFLPPIMESQKWCSSYYLMFPTLCDCSSGYLNLAYVFSFFLITQLINHKLQLNCRELCHFVWDVGAPKINHWKWKKHDFLSLMLKWRSARFVVQNWQKI